jgi:peptidoglycan/LPS O-acetylase OafA/YrhL
MSDTQAVSPPPASGGKKSFGSMPVTKLGWWAVWLMAAFAVMLAVNSPVFMSTSGSDAPWRQVVLPYYGVAMMACGLVAGIVGLTAILKKKERSWILWLPLAGGLFVVTFLLGEFLLPH